MGENNYTVAIEISSSKISGTVSYETYEGIRILAATSIPADGAISRGTVRNVDNASKAINCIINNLEEKLDSDLGIKRAYISLAGLTIQSINSKITRDFGSHTKITADIIDEMERENDELFQIPEGYSRVGVITQEYKMDGKTERDPIGMPAMSIEGNYLNIIIKRQYLQQLEECFGLADVEIADSFIAARMEAEIRLTDEERNNGCAMVDIGAETTTITIYRNGNLRKLVVLPLGSMNVTRDLCSANIAFDEAEEIKFTRGYKTALSEEKPLDNETVNRIINARYGEILQNVKYQIEESGEIIQQVSFIGGGSKLKNFALLLEEYLPEFRTEVKPDPQFNLLCAPGVNTTDTFSATLYGLLKKGKENCCEKTKPVQPVNGGFLFPEENEPQQPIAEKTDKPAANEENAPAEIPEKNEQKTEETKPKSSTNKHNKKSWKRFGNLFDGLKSFVNSATSSDEDHGDDETDEESDENEKNKKNKKNDITNDTKQ